MKSATCWLGLPAPCPAIHRLGGQKPLPEDSETHAQIEADGQRSALPLARKTARVLAEHAALALAYIDDVVDIMNADRGAE